MSTQSIRLFTFSRCTTRKYLSLKYEWAVLTVTSVGTIMGGIDSRIVIVGLPTVARQLHASPEELVWITQSFVLASTVCLLLVGNMGDIYGRVKMYNLGFLVFTIGSGLSAMSADPPQLIVFRVVQGVGAAMIFTNSGAIITDASPPKSVGFMLGVNQMVLKGGGMLGLTLSGLILSLVDWRGLFYVNVPIGILGTIWAYVRLRDISVKVTKTAFDWRGFLSFTSGLSLVLLGITFLAYGLSDALRAYIFLLTGSAMLLSFAWLESKSTHPFLDLKLFKIRVFAFANIAQFLNSLTWTGFLLILAFYLQIGLGFTPLDAGLGIIPTEVVFLIVTLVSSRLSDAHGSRYLATSGLVINTIGFAILSTFTVSTTYVEIALVLTLFGIGNGLFNTPNTREIMTSVPIDNRGIASGLRNMMYNLGLTLSYGVAVVLITIGIPYGSFNELLQGTTQQTALSLSKLEFVSGFRIASIVFALIVGLAILPSWMRGPRASTTA